MPSVTTVVRVVVVIILPIVTSIAIDTWTCITGSDQYGIVNLVTELNTLLK